MQHRYFIELQYKGTNYHGWQIQPNAISVQEIVTNALQTVLREDISLAGCGRTDTGVHAAYFVAHFDSCQAELQLNQKLLMSLNGFLPADIQIFSLVRTSGQYHSRFDALKRTYHYYVRHTKDPFRTELSAFFPVIPDYNIMNTACQHLLGKKDFKSFCKTKSDTATNICEVFNAFWKPIGNEYVLIIEADRFLRNMVRAIVGTIVAIGLGKISIDELVEIIELKDRTLAGPSVPAHGLYLVDVKYPEQVLKRTLKSYLVIN